MTAVAGHRPFGSTNVACNHGRLGACTPRAYPSHLEGMRVNGVARAGCIPLRPGGDRHDPISVGRDTRCRRRADVRGRRGVPRTRFIPVGLVVVVLAAGCSSKAGTPNLGLAGTTSTRANAVHSPALGASTAEAAVDGRSRIGRQLTATAGPLAMTPLCPASVLRLAVEVRRSDQSIGQAVRRLVLRNGGAAACSVRGYPAVSLLDGAFQPMPLRIHRTGADVAGVVLNRGESAQALIETSELPGPAGSCAPASVYVGVRLDGWARSLSARGEVPRCGGDLRVNPLRGG